MFKHTCHEVQLEVVRQLAKVTASNQTLKTYAMIMMNMLSVTFIYKISKQLELETSDKNHTQ